MHTHLATTACEIAAGVDRKNIPHIVTLHGYDASAALKNPATIKKYKEMFRCVSQIIVLTSIVKKRLVNHGCDPNLISVWNIPAGVELFPFQRKKRGETIRLLMAARFTEAKGHIYALESMQKLIRRGRRLQLTCVGYGDQAADLRSLVTKMGLEACVSIIDNKLKGDFNTEFRAYLNETDIYLTPSVQDRFGSDEGGPSLTTVCAQAAGVPVICTPFPGSEISIIDGKTGLLCKERDSESLAEKIEKLIEDEEFANRIGKAGSILVKHEFSEAEQMQKLQMIYDKCLGIEEAESSTPSAHIISNWNPSITINL